jgi:general secretion pathway protein M
MIRAVFKQSPWRTVLRWREQPPALFGAALVLCLVVGATLWYPLKQEQDALEARIAEQHELLGRMSDAAARLRLAPGAETRRSAPRRDGSLFALLERTARAASIAVTRMEPQGERVVRLWLEDVEFNRLVAWLGQVRNQYGIRVSAMQTNRRPVNGRVSAGLVLEDFVAAPVPRQ